MKRFLFFLAVAFLIAVVPASSQDKILAGKTYLKEGKLPEAISMFRKVLEVNPQNTEISLLLGNTYLTINRGDSAEILGKEVLLQNEKNIEAILLVTKAQMAQKKYDDAYATLRKGFKSVKDDASLLVQLGYLHLASDSTHKAEVAFSQAKQITPKDPLIYRGLGDVYLKMGAEPIAIMQYEKSLEYDSVQVDLRIQLADLYLRDRQYNEAAKMYIAVLRQQPNNDKAAYEVGRIYSMSKQYSSAAHYLETYVLDHPEDKDTWGLYMVALDKSRQYESSLKAAEHLLQTNPKNPKALSLAGKAQFIMREYQGAIGYFQRLEAVDTLSVEDAKSLGKAYLAVKNDSLATLYLQKSLDMDSTQSDIYNDLGGAYMRLKKFGPAAAMFEKKFHQDTTYATAYVNYALCNMAMQKWELSREALYQAIRMRPSYVYGHLYLARTLSQMDSIKAARNSYLVAAQLADSLQDRYKNELGEAYRYVTFTYLVEKVYAPALESVTKAVQFRPTDLELQLWRAQILHALDKRDEAKKQYQKVLQMDPGNKEAKKGLDLLELYN